MTTKFCIFNTFGECKEAEQYDHLYQKAIGLSTTSGVDVNIIRNNNLHIPIESNIFPLDQYLLDNDLKPLLPKEYENEKKHWLGTKNWSMKYKFDDKFVYFKDHSDRSYDTIEIPNWQEVLIPVDDDGNEIEVESGQ